MFVGIDVGAHGVYVCRSDVSKFASKWPVSSVKLTAGWWVKLHELCQDADVIALEPTGVYSRPLLSFFAATYPAGKSIVEVSHAVTRRFREAHISDTKTDKLDAQALALIAKTFSRIAATCGKLARMLYGIGIRAENGEEYHGF